MWPYRHSGAGRREFRRVVLTSLAKAARIDLDERRERGQRLRARRALRRLEELEQQLAQLDELGATLPRPWYLAPGAELAAGGVCVAVLALLAAVVAAHGTKGLVVGLVDVAMLVSTVAWFAVAVARRGGETAGRRPSFEGSSDPVGGR